MTEKKQFGASESDSLFPQAKPLSSLTSSFSGLRRGLEKPPPAKGIGKGILLDNTIEMVVVPCRECGTKILWTGIYGDWCSVCKPRDLPLRRR